MKKFFIITIFFFVLGSGIAHSETSQDDIIGSAETLISKIWAPQLKNGINTIRHIKGSNYSYYDVRRIVLVGNISYDIKKTDSIVSPYSLILYFKSEYLDNTTGPNANGSHSSTLNKTYGYKTINEALANVTAKDFVDRNFMDMKVYYAFQKNNWVLKGGNSVFEANFLKNAEKIDPVASFLKLTTIVPVN